MEQEKKQYETPELFSHGRLEEITLGSYYNNYYGTNANPPGYPPPSSPPPSGPTS